MNLTIDNKVTYWNESGIPTTDFSDCGEQDPCLLLIEVEENDDIEVWEVVASYINSEE